MPAPLQKVSRPLRCHPDDVRWARRSWPPKRDAHTPASAAGRRARVGEAGGRPRRRWQTASACASVSRATERSSVARARNARKRSTVAPWAGGGRIERAASAVSSRRRSSTGLIRRRPALGDRRRSRLVLDRTTAAGDHRHRASSYGTGSRPARTASHRAWSSPVFRPTIRRRLVGVGADSEVGPVDMRVFVARHS